MRPSAAIPIIDLFAGPGGLGEGFSAFGDYSGIHFDIKLSIEKDKAAHKTLRLRSFYRQFKDKDVPLGYYRYVTGQWSLEKLIDSYPTQWEAACNEAWLCELGSKEFPDAMVDDRITKALNGAKEWVLIGGPPCQAYSVIGRSVMRGKDPQAFEKDHRHFLYKQYLRIIEKFKPSIFVMENVKGLLSSKINDQFIFHKIHQDLKLDGDYKIYSLSNSSDKLLPQDFVVRTEEFGVPQSRHRVILVGVRSNCGLGKPDVLNRKKGCAVYPLLKDLPKRQSGLTSGESSRKIMRKILKQAAKIIKTSKLPKEVKIVCKNALGGRLPKTVTRTKKTGSRKVLSWLSDKRLKVMLNHDARSHMASDIQRYFFASCYAAAMGVSPKLKDFPKALLPKHKNTKDFADRFRVQVAGRSSTTILSHIAKDGHYYIHPDPRQSRSFTVREAARLQTFPDNYFFEGHRSQQYAQVGNAVPPFLALQIAEVASQLLARRKSRNNITAKAAASK
jgi:DNA (cytosine-5)-methyltransferase 1